MFCNEELEEILATIRNYQEVSTMGSTADRIAERAEEYVLFELSRRKHGPFTLAEAITSGRPFRRKAWGDDSSFCRMAKDDSSSWFDSGWQTDCISADDITATDYEIQPEGGE